MRILHVPIFTCHDTSRRTELSVAGEGLLDQARRVLAAEEHARLAISEFKRSAKHRLRIGICERITCSRIAGALVDWRRTNPDVALQIVSRSGRALLGEIEAGLLDAGITAIRVNESGMVADQLWTDAWVAAVPKNHLLASGRAIEPADLTRERLALLAPDPICTLEQQIIEHMPTDSPLFIAERPSTALALMTWVEAGCGLGLLTASQGEGVVHANVIFRPLRCGLPPAVMHLLRCDAPPSPLLSGLIECLRATRP